MEDWTIFGGCRERSNADWKSNEVGTKIEQAFMPCVLLETQTESNFAFIHNTLHSIISWGRVIFFYFPTSLFHEVERLQESFFNFRWVHQDEQMVLLHLREVTFDLVGSSSGVNSGSPVPKVFREVTWEFPTTRHSSPHHHLTICFPCQVGDWATGTWVLIPGFLTQNSSHK